MIHWPKRGLVRIFTYLALTAFIFSHHQSIGGEAFPAKVQTLEITSSLDGSDQASLFYYPETPKSGQPVPLLIGLHTWSGDYLQDSSVPMAKGCIERGWAFLHPNFRGPNWTPEACGSDLAVQDVMDAIRHVQANYSIDSRRLYLMGTSGGGHMTLLLAGRYPALFAAASAWVPISDLSAWYYECQLSGRRYAHDLLKSIGGPPHESTEIRQDYHDRSPLRWLNRDHSIPIDINAGIRDGHEGSVPISHSLNAFNRLAAPEDRLSDMDILEFTGKSQVPERLVRPQLSDLQYGSKQPLFRRQSGKVRVTIFDGGHEGIPSAGLAWLATQNKLKN